MSDKGYLRTALAWAGGVGVSGTSASSALERITATEMGTEMGCIKLVVVLNA